MKLFTFFMYNVDGENISSSPSNNQMSMQQEKVENKEKQAKKPNIWQRIKNELQGWSNKDADDSAFDDTQV